MISSHSLINLQYYTVNLEDIDNSFFVDSILQDPVSPYAPGFLETHNHTFHEDTVLKDTPQLRTLQKAICDTMLNIFDKEYVVEYMWAITLRKGQHVMAHTHKSNYHMDPKEYYSIAYYPAAPQGSADLIFNLNYCNLIEDVQKVTPSPGTLVIFNSYVPHMTSVHQSDDPRIVISANLAPLNPNREIFPDYSPYKLIEG